MTTQTKKYVRRGVAAVAIGTAVTTGLVGCGFGGANTLPVPGAPGTGDGSYRVSAIIPTAAGLVTNAPIMLDDATIGSIGKITVDNWNARVEMRMNKGAQIPSGSHVMVGMTSVLGSSHLQILQPDSPGGSMMRAGDTIPLAKCPEQQNIAGPADKGKAIPDVSVAQQVSACAFPTTEQVLSSLSVVLNGGGLAQFGDIVTEVNKTFDGRQDAIADLVPRMNKLVGTLNAQRGNIIKAIDGLDRLTQTMNEQAPTIEKALADSPKILQLLVDQKQQLVDALGAIGKLSDTADDILKANGDDIRTAVKALEPTLAQLESTGPSLAKSLGVLLSFPFPEKAISNVVRGDYVNTDLNLDLTFYRLGKTLFPSVLGSRIIGPEAVAGRPAGAAGRGLNPFRSPMQRENLNPQNLNPQGIIPGLVPGQAPGARKPGAKKPKRNQQPGRAPR
ncbi:MAG: MCE family protein [Gordonia sp. (in: high G+C Gram-positive bacteria)]|uniref:MCE family protein n=1 Tax=Gordonia sp. (in: high G+C Gram-positive bacteria) TaxID=84139 RepID=UPI0039E31493